MLDPGIVWSVVTEPALLVLLALTAVLAWPLGSLLARRGRCRRGLGVLFVAVLGAVLAATTTTGARRMPVTVQLGAVRADLGQFVDPVVQLAAARGFAGNAERLANIGLFLPLGLLATLIWQRPGRVAACGAALSFLVELWQAVIGRGGELADVLHNSAGALLGASLGVLVLRVAPRLARSPGMPAGLREPVG
jgi:hypothetical protein